MVKRTVGVNENGHRIGQDHRSKLSDRDVELIIELRWRTTTGGLARLAGLSATLFAILPARAFWL